MSSIIIFNVKTESSPAVVLIKMLKSFVQMFISFEPMPVHCCSDKFNVVNRTISINISLQQNPRLTKVIMYWKKKTTKISMYDVK